MSLRRRIASLLVKQADRAPRAPVNDEWVDVYRGLRQPFDGKHKGNPNNWYGESVSVSRSPKSAAHYAYDGEGANIMPMQVKGAFMPRDEFIALKQSYMKDVIKGAKWTKQKEDRALARAIEEAKRRGYTGVDSPMDEELAVWPDASGGFPNMRSRFERTGNAEPISAVRRRGKMDE